MPLLPLVWLLVGLVVIVIAHELTHVAVARAFGHRLVCVAFNPLGVAVVFEDTPEPRYWLLQAIAPALVTWVLTLAWLLGLGLLFQPQLTPPLLAHPPALLALVTLLVVLTSGGDITALLVERRRPLWGDARVLRDLRLLRRFRSLVLFSSYGRRWLPAWKQLGAREPAGIGA